MPPSVSLCFSSSGAVHNASALTSLCSLHVPCHGLVTADNLARTVHLPLQTNCMWSAALLVQAPPLPQSADAAASFLLLPHQTETLLPNITAPSSMSSMSIPSITARHWPWRWMSKRSCQRNRGEDDLLAVVKKNAM